MQRNSLDPGAADRQLTPHGLRRSFASLLYGIGEPPPVLMAEMGHTDPALAPSIYAHAMRRDDGENDRLRDLVDGQQLALLETVTAAASEGASRLLPSGR